MNMVSLITGGSRGLGRNTALSIARHGGDVILTYRTGEDAAHEVVAEIERLGRKAAALQLDVANVSTFAAFAERVRSVLAEKWGRSSLDHLINNAGHGAMASIAETTEAQFDELFDTHVKGVFFLTQRLLPLLEARATADDPARVINIGSIDGIKTPAFETVSYGPSKAAVHSLTRQLAPHLVRRNIIVNAIAPGPFPTWMLSTGVGGGGDVDNTDWGAVARTNPRGRVGTPEDIAGLAIFLASRAGAFTVGEVITCDGGIVASS